MKFQEAMKQKRRHQHKDKLGGLLYQPASNIFLWIFMNLNISANTVGFIMAMMSIVASFLFLTGVKDYLMIGSMLFIVAMILDFTDGDVARRTRIFSKTGLFFDHIHHTCEELFTFLGLGLLVGMPDLGLMITFLILIPNYFRATMFWLMKKDLSYEMKYRKLPLVLIYGDFFKWWHLIILISLIFNLEYYIIYIAFIWAAVRFIPNIYIYFYECELYDKT